MAGENEDFFTDEAGNSYRWSGEVGWVPVEKLNPVQAALVGAGSTFDKWGTGLGQMLGVSDRADYERMMADRALMQQTAGQTNPLAVGVGEMLPSLATMPIGGVGAQLAIGGIEGALSPAESWGERAINAGVGVGMTGAGMGIGRMAGKVSNAISKMAPDAVGAAARAGAAADDVATPAIVSRAEALGFKLRPGDRIDDEIVKRMDIGAARSPFTAPYFQKIEAQNRGVVANAVGEALGVNPQRLALDEGKITSEALAEVRGELGGYFERLDRLVPEVSIGPKMAERIKAVDTFKKLRGVSGGDVFAKLDEGKITGPEYKTIRSTLTEFAGKEGGQVAYETGRLIDELDTAVGELLPAEELERFARQRQRWQLLETVEGGKTLRPDGTFNLDTLTNRVKSAVGSRAFMERDYSNLRPETANLVEVLRTATDPRIRPSVGTSGTAEGLLGAELADLTGEALQGNIGAMATIARKAGSAKLYEIMAEGNPRALAALLQASPEIAGQAGAQAGRSVAAEFGE